MTVLMFANLDFLTRLLHLEKAEGAPPSQHLELD